LNRNSHVSFCLHVHLLMCQLVSEKKKKSVMSALTESKSKGTMNLQSG